MPNLSPQLELSRCPHCSVAWPLLHLGLGSLQTAAHDGRAPRWWKVYVCATCGGAILAASNQAENGLVTEFYPFPTQVDETIPDPARSYLSQAIETIHAPAGSLLLAASAVDAMLKAKDYTEGSLNSRINKAAEDYLITQDMAEWAHEVRLDANAQQHADGSISLPSEADAKRSVEFARALAEFLFVLPARVKRGREEPTT
jgi:hypothetical protein